jgi:hypothetical protein
MLLTTPVILTLSLTMLDTKGGRERGVAEE